MTDNIKINYINLIGYSSLIIYSDTCAICTENIIDKCVDCNDSNCKTSCYSIVGTCNHAYHYCCINNWLSNNNNSNKTCPLCKQKWEFKKKSFPSISKIS